MTVLTDDLLQSFAASIDDVASATTMPPVVYTSEEFMAFEKRALFDHEWLCVGVASSIPASGDYFTCTVNDEPNKAMRGVNIKLGYQPVPDHIELEKRL